MKVAAIADTHGQLPEIRGEYDVFIHAGDISGPSEIDLQLEFYHQKFVPWLSNINAPVKIFIAGNHDWFCTKPRIEWFDASLNQQGIHYLQDSATSVDGVLFYGTPWTPWFCDWAFNAPKYDYSGEFLRKKYGQIPSQTEVLITHGPPDGILDLNRRGRHVGSIVLSSRLAKLKHLKYNVFGHIHEAAGQWNQNGVRYINCSYGYEWEDHPPLKVFEITKENHEAS